MSKDYEEATARLMREIAQVGRWMLAVTVENHDLKRRLGEEIPQQEIEDLARLKEYVSGLEAGGPKS